MKKYQRLEEGPGIQASKTQDWMKVLDESLSKSQVNTLIKDIKEISIIYAEGRIEYSKKATSKKFKNIDEAEKFFNSVPYPDMGYDKHDMLITFKNGNQIKGFIYDHGKKDPSFSKQLNWYFENNISFSDVKDDFTDKIKDLIQSNNHIEAYLEIAKKFNLSKYIKIFNSIEEIIKIEGHLPQGLNQYENNTTKEMFSFIKKKDKDYADKLWKVL